MKVCIIGMGLIGGSLALDLKERKFADLIIGVGNTAASTQKAIDLKLVDKVLPMDEAIAEADLIVLATPIDIMLTQLPYILDRVTTQTVTDMGSAKLNLVETVKDHPNRHLYVPSHPMAGTEYSGPAAAINNLFDGKTAILCDVEESDKNSVAIVKNMYEVLNMQIVYMKSVNHDIHVAYVSHISHITSFVLAETVLDKEKDEKNIFDLASGGFTSTVRLAKSSSKMWIPIFNQNTENIITVMDSYISNFQKFRDAIASHDNDKIDKLINDANRIKDILDAKSIKL